MLLVFLAMVAASTACRSAGEAVEPRDRTVYGRPGDPTRTADPAPLPSVVCPEPIPTSVTRQQLVQVLDDGIGRLLARVRLVPVLDGEGPGARFVGHRIVALDRSVRCGPFGLREGDIVFAVNGHSVERDSDAFQVWQQLYSATVITLSVIRGGVATELHLTVVDRTTGSDSPETSTVPGPGS